jgi:hypothetical protein
MRGIKNYPKCFHCIPLYCVYIWYGCFDIWAIRLNKSFRSIKMVLVTSYFKMQGPTSGNSRHVCCSQSQIGHKPIHTNVHWFEHRFNATVTTNNFLYIIVFMRPWSVILKKNQPINMLNFLFNLNPSMNTLKS